MPLLTITTNTQIEDTSAFSEQASSLVAKLLGKPESYVMVSVTDNHNLVFAGNHEPCALLELKSLGLPENSTAEFSSSLCTFIEQQLGINSARVYVEFSNPDRHMWGWDKRTF